MQLESCQPSIGKYTRLIYLKILVKLFGFFIQKGARNRHPFTSLLLKPLIQHSIKLCWPCSVQWFTLGHALICFSEHRISRSCHNASWYHKLLVFPTSCCSASLHAKTPLCSFCNILSFCMILKVICFLFALLQVSLSINLFSEAAVRREFKKKKISHKDKENMMPQAMRQRLHGWQKSMSGISTRVMAAHGVYSNETRKLTFESWHAL